MSRIISFIVIFFMFQLLTAQSDLKSKEIVKEVEEAMGGVENYNNIPFVQWDFAKRKLFWNKWTGDVRIENPSENQVIFVNINTLKGKVYNKGVLMNDAVLVDKTLKKAKNWWINDSYWLVMPWKLKDEGVSLKYLGEALLDNNKVEILQMTFNNVGVTPDNKYLIYIDKNDHLIKQWAFYKNYNDHKPKFKMLWNNYQKLENTLFSFNRTKGTFGPKNVVVKKEFEATIFTEL